MNNLIIGGVVQNSTAEWLYEDALMGTNLDYEIHLAECPNEDHDDCWENVGSETWLIGFMECEPSEPKAWCAKAGAHDSFGFKPDPMAEYSAIMGEVYTQVVASQWAADCRMCSPCYPEQGDLDSPGNFPTYSLPPDMYGENTPEIEIVKLTEELVNKDEH